MSFRQKILLAMVWLLTLSYGLGGALLITQGFQAALAQEKANAVTAYEMTAQTVQLVRLVDVRQDLSVTRSALDRMEQVSNQAGLRLSRDGETVYQAGEPFEPMPDTADSRMRLIAAEDRRLLQIGGPVRTGGSPLRLEIRYDVTPIYDSRARQISNFQKVFLLLLILGGAAAWGLARLLTGPFGRLTAAAQRLSAGELEARAELRTRDEVGRLGVEFDRMAEKLSETITAQQEEMARQEQFMGSFAHELKTPMTSIIGYADLLRGQSLDPQEAQEAANYIFSEGKRLESLSLKLLDLLLTEQRSLRFVAADPAPLIERLTAHLQPVYRGGGITLQSRCEPGLCRLEPDLFASVLTNLLDNARKALDRGGNIFVLGKRLPEGYEIQVLDNGRGMPEEALLHLTEAFYRVDKSRSRAQGGAGLGLTLCSRILELHGGTISFRSREGVGTIVTVLLPHAEPGKEEVR